MAQLRCPYPIPAAFLRLHHRNPDRCVSLLQPVPPPQDFWLFFERRQAKSKKGHASSQKGRLTEIHFRYVHSFFAAMFATMNVQMLPGYLVSVGGGKFAGIALSSSKMGGLVSLLLQPYLLKTCGLLGCIYLSLISSLFGTVLFSVNSLLQRDTSITLVSLLAIGFDSNHLLMSLTYISLTASTKEQQTEVPRLYVCFMVGLFVAPLVLMVWQHPILPSGMLSIWNCVHIFHLYKCYGNDWKKYCTPWVRPFTISPVQIPHDSLGFVFFYVFISFLPVLYSGLFSTLLQVMCANSFGWKPADMIRILVPGQLCQIIGLNGFHHLISRISLFRVLVLSIFFQLVGLSVAFWFSWSSWAFVLSYCFGMLSEAINIVTPIVLLGSKVSPPVFGTVLTATSLIDATVGSVAPMLWLFVYSTSQASNAAAVFLVAYQSLVCANALLLGRLNRMVDSVL